MTAPTDEADEKIVEQPDDADHEYIKWLGDAYKLLPAWFVGRMIFDEWSFGLQLVTSHALAARQIIFGKLHLRDSALARCGYRRCRLCHFSIGDAIDPTLSAIWFDRAPH